MPYLSAQEGTRLPVGWVVVLVEVTDKVVAIAANVDAVLNVVDGYVLVVEADVVEVVGIVVVENTVCAGPSL